MFSGEHYYRVDIQGRVPIPPRFRPQFGGVAMLTRGFDHCITVQTLDEWKQRAEKIAQLPDTRLSNRRLQRMLIARATEAEIDKQGRIKIPPFLREYAGVDQDVVVVGIANRLEIWDKVQWDREGELLDDTFDQIAEDVED